jgi:hypothetical protein
MPNREDLESKRCSEMKTSVLTKSSEFKDRDLADKILFLLWEISEEFVDYDNTAIYFYYFGSNFC